MYNVVFFFIKSGGENHCSANMSGVTRDFAATLQERIFVWEVWKKISCHIQMPFAREQDGNNMLIHFVHVVLY